MAFLFFMTLPGLVVLLFALAVVDRLGWWISGRSKLPWYRDGHRLATAVGLDELQSVFHPGKLHAIEQRRLELVLRDEENDGATPIRFPSGSVKCPTTSAPGVPSGLVPSPLEPRSANP